MFFLSNLLGVSLVRMFNQYREWAKTLSDIFSFILCFWLINVLHNFYNQMILLIDGRGEHLQPAANSQAARS